MSLRTNLATLVAILTLGTASAAMANEEPKQFQKPEEIYSSAGDCPGFTKTVYTASLVGQKFEDRTGDGIPDEINLYKLDITATFEGYLWDRYMVNVYNQPLNCHNFPEYFSTMRIRDQKAATTGHILLGEFDRYDTKGKPVEPTIW